MTSGIPKGKRKLTDEELKANRRERDRVRRKIPQIGILKIEFHT